MVAAIAIGGITAILTLAVVAATTAAMRRSLADKQREQALQLAEAGVNQGIDWLNNDGKATATNPPSPLSKAWVVSSAASLPVFEGREGQFSFLIPANGLAVYGVGYVPSRANAAATRVIELKVQRIVSTGNAGLISGGQTTMTGDALIANGADVYTNGNFVLDGSAIVSGSASSGGTITVTGSAAIQGPKTSGTEVLSLSLDPLAYRAKTQYDLCPDGTVRNTAGSPCLGTILGIGGGLGWDWKNGAWERKPGDSAGTGLGFYGYQVNAEIKGNWTGFLVTSPLTVGGVRLNGDITSNGNTSVQYQGVDGIALVAGRDLVLQGNTEVVGDVLVQEQASLSGSSVLKGQLTAVSNGDSAGSPVNTTQLFGNAQIRYSPSTIGDPSGVAPTAWTEVR